MQCLLRQRTNFTSHFNAIWVVQIARQKYFASHFPQISLHLRAIPPHRRGAYASSRYVECGLRWTRWRCAREALQGGLKLGLGAVSDRSAQDERRCCVRQKRVVLAPVAGVKLAEVVRNPNRVRISRQSGSDGGKRNSSPGRARHKPSNHCAGKAGCSPLDLYARVRTSLCTLHTRPRVQRAPGLPCALSCRRGQATRHNSGASRRENALAYPHPSDLIRFPPIIIPS